MKGPWGGGLTGEKLKAGVWGGGLAVAKGTRSREREAGLGRTAPHSTRSSAPAPTHQRTQSCFPFLCGSQEGQS